MINKFKPILFLCVFLFSALNLVACGSTGMSSRTPSSYGLAKTRPDPMSTRQIVMSHPYSGEHLNVVYFHDGHYDTKIMKQIDRLFRDRHANVIGKIDPELIDYLVDIRTRLGLPDTVNFEILSGYRTTTTNAQLARHDHNVAKESYHIHGWAVDFRLPGVNGKAICEIAKTMQRGGVAYYSSDNHVHVDLGNIRTWKQK